MASKSMDRSALFFSVAVLVVLLVLGACGPRVQAQARIPRNPAPTAHAAQSDAAQPAVTPTPWRPCENNRRTTPRNCNEDRRIHQSGDRNRVR